MNKLGRNFKTWSIAVKFSFIFLNEVWILTQIWYINVLQKIRWRTLCSRSMLSLIDYCYLWILTSSLYSETCKECIRAGEREKIALRVTPESTVDGESPTQRWIYQIQRSSLCRLGRSLSEFTQEINAVLCVVSCFNYPAIWLGE